VLGVAGLLVIGVDRLRAALRPFNVLEDQPAALLLLLEVIGQAAAANDLGERLLQGLDPLAWGASSSSSAKTTYMAASRSNENERGTWLGLGVQPLWMACYGTAPPSLGVGELGVGKFTSLLGYSPCNLTLGIDPLCSALQNWPTRRACFTDQDRHISI